MFRSRRMQRRLTAIVSADVAGYSGLMEADEAGTLERLKINRSRIFDPCVAAHGGRPGKLLGGGALVGIGGGVGAGHFAPGGHGGGGRAPTERDEATRPLHP